LDYSTFFAAAAAAVEKGSCVMLNDKTFYGKVSKYRIQKVLLCENIPTKQASRWILQLIFVKLMPPSLRLENNPICLT